MVYLTYELFCKAAEALQAEGKHLSPKAVRERVGVGSYSTIIQMTTRYLAENGRGKRSRDSVTGA